MASLSLAELEASLATLKPVVSRLKALDRESGESQKKIAELVALKQAITAIDPTHIDALKPKKKKRNKLPVPSPSGKSKRAAAATPQDTVDDQLSGRNKDARIAIIGSGIAGCTLAVALKRKGFKNVAIFEKDSSFHTRRQGYGITIQQAVKSLLDLGISSIIDLDTPSTARYIFSESGNIISFFGRTFYSFVNSRKFNVHLSRQDLRYLLLREVESQVVWNRSLRGIQYNEKSVTLEFDGSTHEADIVVGADGIYSKVRNLTFESQRTNSADIDCSLNYLGVIVVLGIVHCEHELLKEVVFESSNGTVRIFCMPFSSHFNPTRNSTIYMVRGVPRTMWQLSFPIDLAHGRDLCRDKKKLKQICLESISAFHAPVPDMINLTKLEDMMATPVFDFDPLTPQALGEFPYTALVGDASHAMSPFKSQGANRAILDAVALADRLSSLPLTVAISSYESATAPKNIEKVLVSREKVAKLHCPSVANDFLNRTDVPNYQLTRTLKENHVGSWTKNLDVAIKSLVVIPAQPKQTKIVRMKLEQKEKAKLLKRESKRAAAAAAIGASEDDRRHILYPQYAKKKKTWCEGDEVPPGGRVVYVNGKPKIFNKYYGCACFPLYEEFSTLHDYGGAGWTLTSLDMAKELYANDPGAVHRSVMGYVPLANAVKGDAPLEVIEYIYSLNPEHIKFVVEKSGWTLLHIAARNCAAFMIPFLLKQYPEAVFVKDKRGRTPRDCAVEEAAWWNANPVNCVCCGKYPRTFNLPNETEPLYCTVCCGQYSGRDGTMVDVKNGLCTKCKERPAGYNVLTESEALYCGLCADRNMFNLETHIVLPGGQTVVDMLTEFEEKLKRSARRTV
jgi:salicylate hydroxylase